MNSKITTLSEERRNELRRLGRGWKSQIIGNIGYLPICPDCYEDLEDISSFHRDLTKIQRCNNEKCEGTTRFYDEELEHIICSICEAQLFKIDHVIPDLFVDINEDGHRQWICRNCSFGILLL